MNEETKRILIITIGIFLSVITGTYIYTQNTGYNACYKNKLSIEEEHFESKWERHKYTEQRSAHFDCDGDN